MKRLAGTVGGAPTRAVPLAALDLVTDTRQKALASDVLARALIAVVMETRNDERAVALVFMLAESVGAGLDAADKANRALQ